jgi:hypothetical protein
VCGDIESLPPAAMQRDQMKNALTERDGDKLPIPSYTAPGILEGFIDRDWRVSVIDDEASEEGSNEGSIYGDGEYDPEDFLNNPDPPNAANTEIEQSIVEDDGLSTDGDYNDAVPLPNATYTGYQTGNRKVRVPRKKKPQLFLCPMCTFSARSMGRLNRHTNAKHKENE